MHPLRSGLIALLMIATLLSACASGPRFATLNARVVSQEPVELSDDAELRVQLEDMTEGALIAVTTYTRLGSSPFDVSLRYDVNAIDDDHDYALRAQLRSDGRTTHIDTEPVAVLDGGAAERSIEIELEPTHH